MGATSLNDLNGMAKQVYGEDLIKLQPELKLITSRIKFSQRDTLGGSYHVPMVVASNQGFTYAGPDEDSFALNDAISMVTQDATVKGSQIAGRHEMGYKAASALLSKGPKAFASGLTTVIDNMHDQATRRVEVAILYGQSGLGVVTSSVNVSATETTVTFSAATWAPGLFISEANAPIDFYNGATLIATVAVKKVSSLSARTLVVTGLAGQITALDAALPGTLNVFFEGAKDKEMLGIDKIITTSGVLFGIDNNVYDLAKGQIYDAGSAPLTFDKATDAIVDAILFGLDKNVTLLVSPRTWQDLNKDEAALRRYDASYSDKAKKGNSGIVFKIMNIDVEILSHNMVKQGEAFIFDFNDLLRVGTTDITMQTPGHGGELFLQTPGKTSFEMRLYTDQAVFAKRPARMTKIVNIVNS